jgi:hypothetical protein
VVASGDKLCGLLSAIFQATAHHPPTVSLSAFLGFVYWKIMWRSAPCSSPLPPTPSAAGPFQFLVYYGVFCFVCGVGVSLSRGLCWFIPGVTVGISHDAYLFTWWSASPKQVWSQCLVAWELSCFLSVMWCGEALFRMAVRGVGVFLLLGGFWLMELTLSASSLQSPSWILSKYLPSVALGWHCHKCYLELLFSEDLGPCAPNGRIQAEHWAFLISTSS